MVENFKSKGIRNIIFDLGGVILNLDFEATFLAFRKLGSNATEPETKEAYANPVFLDFETGRITAAEFRQKFHKYLNNPSVTDDMIDDAWYAMIKDIPEKRVETLLRLSSDFNLFLFSNTNEIHITRLEKQFLGEHGFEFSSMFRQVFYSHVIHDRKPEVSAFKKVTELAGVAPGETLFVDDLEQNIAAAAKTGLQTLWLKEGMEMAEIFYPLT